MIHDGAVTELKEYNAALCHIDQVHNDEKRTHYCKCSFAREWSQNLKFAEYDTSNSVAFTVTAFTVKMSTNALATHVITIVSIALHLSLIPLDSFAAVELVIISMKTVFDAMTILNVLMVLVAKKMPAVQRPLVHIFVNAMMVTLQLTLPTALITMIYNAKI